MASASPTQRHIPGSGKKRMVLLVLVCAAVGVNSIMYAFAPCRSDERLESLCQQGDRGKLVVVLAFSKGQIQAAVDAVRRWDHFHPCLNKNGRDQNILLLYSDDLLDETTENGALLQAAVSEVEYVEKCFGQVHYSGANLKPEDNIYVKGKDSHLWVRGPNQLFYTLMLGILQRDSWKELDVQHVYWMEPDNSPVQQEWLWQLQVHAGRGPYWIQGSTYRGKCLPDPGGNCTLLGRAIKNHINGNALYHSGDRSFIKFVAEVSQGEWQHWPYDLAMLKHLVLTLPEPQFRGVAHLYQHVDWARNYGPYPFHTSSLPKHVIFVHADKKPAIAAEFPDSKGFKMAETDAKEDEERALMEQAAWLKNEVDRLQARVGMLEGARPEAESRREEPEVAARPADPKLVRVLEAAANSKKQVMMVTVARPAVPFLSNFLHFVAEAGLGGHTILVPLDPTARKAVKASASKVAATYDITVLDDLKSEAEERDARYTLIARCLRQGYHVVSSTLDVVWLSSPFTSLFGSFDFQIQSGSRTGFSEEVGDKLAYKNFIETGVHYSRSTARTIRFFDQLLAQFAANHDINERDALLGLLNNDATTSSLQWRMLEPALYPNGVMYYEHRLPQRVGVKPVAVINDWAGTESSKMYRMQEGGYWVQDEKTIAGLRKDGVKFLTYFDVVGNNGLNNQRQALHNALSVARLLGRHLILPKFHQEHLVDSSVTVDYFFDYSKFQNFGHDVLPHSYLDIAFPDWEQLPVQVMDVKVPGVPKDADWSDRAVIVEPKAEWHGATEEEILKWYSGKADELLVFFGMFRRFGKLNDLGRHEQFNREFFTATQPAPRTMRLVEYMSEAVLSNSENREFNCLHLRHAKEYQLDHPKEETSLSGLAKIVASKLPLNQTLYMATDVANDETRQAFLDAGFPKVLFTDDFFPRWELPHIMTLDGGTSMRKGQIEQWVCSQGIKFVGNVYSTFTFHIAFIRGMKGLPDRAEDIFDRDTNGLEFL